MGEEECGLIDPDEGEEGDDDDAETDEEAEAEVVNARDSLDQLPVLVFEGLPFPRPDQTEEDQVDLMLQNANLTEATVKNALRLPIKSPKGKSLVLVEVDTLPHEKKILMKSNKKKIKAFVRASRIARNKKPGNLGIRAAKYRELWTYLKFLTVDKVSGGSVPSKQPSLG